MNSTSHAFGWFSNDPVLFFIDQSVPVGHVGVFDQRLTRYTLKPQHISVQNAGDAEKQWRLAVGRRLIIYAITLHADHNLKLLANAASRMLTYYSTARNSDAAYSFESDLQNTYTYFTRDTVRLLRELAMFIGFDTQSFLFDMYADYVPYSVEFSHELYNSSEFQRRKIDESVADDLIRPFQDYVRMSYPFIQVAYEVNAALGFPVEHFTRATVERYFSSVDRLRYQARYFLKLIPQGKDSPLLRFASVY